MEDEELETPPALKVIFEFLSKGDVDRFNDEILNYDGPKLVAGIDLSELQFEDAELDGFSFLSTTNLVRTTFRDCSMVGTRFLGVNIVEGRFFDCEMNGCKFIRCELSRTLFRGEKNSLTHAYFGHCKIGVSGSFANKNLNEVKFFMCNLGQISFINSNLNQTEFLHCKLDGANFRGAKVLHTIFRGSNLSKALNLWGADCLHYGKFDLASLGGIYHPWCGKRFGSISKFVSWDKLGFLQSFRAFGASYITLFFIMGYSKFAIYYNNILKELQKSVDKVECWVPKDFVVSPILPSIHLPNAHFELSKLPIPSNFWWQYFGVCCLVLGSTLYVMACPVHIRNYDYMKWTHELDHSEIPYQSANYSRLLALYLCWILIVVGGALTLFKLLTVAYEVFGILMK